MRKRPVMSLTPTYTITTMANTTYSSSSADFTVVAYLLLPRTRRQRIMDTIRRWFRAVLT